MSFRTFDPTLRPPRAQTAYAKGRRGRLPSPAGLGNQGLVQQGQPEVRGIPKHTVTHVEIIPDFYYLIGEEFNKIVEEFLKKAPNLLYIWLYGFSFFIHVNSKNCYRFRLMVVISLKFKNSIADVFRWALALQFIVIIPLV